MKKSITLLALALLTATFTFAQTVIWENSIKPIAGTAKGFNSFGQQFIVSSPNTSIQEVKLYVCKFDDLSNFTISIYNDNGSNQIGTKVIDIYSGISTNLNLLAPTELAINSGNCLNHVMPLILVAGQKYWVVLSQADVQTLWYCDETNASINGTGASNRAFSNSLYFNNAPFFMKITASAPLVTALDKTTSEEVSVEASAKNITINSAFENYNIELFNVAGKKMLSQSVTQSGSTTIVADVTSGIYFVKVSAEGRYFTKKVFLH